MNYNQLPCKPLFIDNELAFYRGKFGYTQEYVAEYLGVSVNSVSSWEHSVNSPSLVHAFAIADLFNVSVLDIFWPSFFFKHSVECLECEYFTDGGCLLEHEYWLSKYE